LKFNKSRYVHIDFRFLDITIEDFDDRVYCVQVPNQTFYCKENEQCFWSGNSSIVNLKNVSHVIKEAHWDGNDLVGTVEVLTTPSGNILKELMKCDIKLGISSRGLGSVKDLGENVLEVQDDYDLVAFDYVSNPSVQGAFLTPSSTLSESVIKQIIKTPHAKIDDIIRNILCELK
jgi:hypothetical protein